mmetsp:Transcript_3411/g.7101  ORF Transcript_3411/g.7101 Transcript_3411/m.7101 type:complete len:276 (-) Transcript_3411:11-838(-)
MCYKAKVMSKAFGKPHLKALGVSVLSRLNGAYLLVDHGLKLLVLLEGAELHVLPVFQGDDHVAPQPYTAPDGDYLRYLAVRNLCDAALEGGGRLHDDAHVGELILEPLETTNGCEGERKPQKGGTKGNVGNQIPNSRLALVDNRLLGEVGVLGGICLLERDILSGLSSHTLCRLGTTASATRALQCSQLRLEVVLRHLLHLGLIGSLHHQALSPVHGCGTHGCGEAARGKRTGRPQAHLPRRSALCGNIHARNRVHGNHRGGHCTPYYLCFDSDA